MFSLADLEELVEQCRSQKAKALLKEATDCYRSGAYRSCVVGTWIALVYDLIEKFRELALVGDVNAVKVVAEIDEIHAQRSTDKALIFEREVLLVAKDQFELISPQEFSDLERLRADRNRFAHPNLNQDLEGISATPELARLHLRNAIEHVLSRPPVQGKAAVASVVSLVESEYFPQDVDEAYKALLNGPLHRAKRALVKNFLFGAITSILREKLTLDQVRQRIAAARACYRMHPVLVEQLLADSLDVVVSKVEDEKVPYLLYLIALFPEITRYVGDAARIRLEKYVPTITEKDLALIVYAGEIEFLCKFANERIKELKPSEINIILERLRIKPTRMLVDSYIQAYESVKSWDSANTLSAAMNAKLLSELTVADACKLLNAAKNGEVKGSFGYPNLIKKLRDSDKLTAEDIRAAAEKYNLDDVLDETLSEIIDL